MARLESYPTKTGLIVHLTKAQASWLGGLVGGSVGILGGVYGIVAGLEMQRMSALDS